VKRAKYSGDGEALGFCGSLRKKRYSVLPRQ
jgi:hypothetical protein